MSDTVYKVRNNDTGAVECRSEAKTPCAYYAAGRPGNYSIETWNTDSADRRILDTEVVKPAAKPLYLYVVTVLAGRPYVVAAESDVAVHEWERDVMYGRQITRLARICTAGPNIKAGESW